MKRIVLLSLIALVLFTACATMSTSPAATTPDVAGVITKIDNGMVTVKSTTGDVQFNIGRVTRVYWPNGEEGDRSNLTVGHSVEVWRAGTETATRINIRS